MGQAQSGPPGPEGPRGPRGDTGLAGPPGKDATVDLKQVTDSIIVNKTFQNQLVPLVSKDNTLTTSVSKEVVNDATFSNTIVNSMATDTRFKGPPGKDSDPQQVATLLAADDTFSTRLAPFVAKDSGLINTVGQQLVQNTTFSNSILGTMASDPRFKGPKGTDSTPQDVANTLSKDTTFTNTVSQKVAGDTTFSNTLINSIAADSRFKGPKGKDADINISTNNMPLLTQNLVSSDAFLANLAPYIANNNQLGQNIATNLASNVVPRTLITNSLTQNENYRKTLIEAMAADTRFRGPQGTPGSALDANSLRLAVEPKSLWCADGQMCKTPTNSPGTIITGDLVINSNNAQTNVRITQGNVTMPGSLNIGNWTISENTAGNLQFTKNGFTNGNVIFDAGKYQNNLMTITAGNFIAQNDLWSNYVYANNHVSAGSLQVRGDVNAGAWVYLGNDWRLRTGGDWFNIDKKQGDNWDWKFAVSKDNLTQVKKFKINDWDIQGGIDFTLSKPRGSSTAQFRLNGGGNDSAYLSGSLTQNSLG